VKRHWKILSISAIVSGAGIVGTLMMPNRSTQASLAKPIQSTPQITATPTPQLSPLDRQKLLTLQFKFHRQQWQKLDLGDRLQIVAQAFIGESYRANLLDQGADEQAFVSLHEFDCVLFLETVLSVTSALSTVDLSALSAYPESSTERSAPIPAQELNLVENTTFQTIQRYRYRDGKLNDYCSRLHYFSDWVLDNQQRGLVKDIGTVPLKRSLNFMTQNWKKYPPIVKTPSLKNCIKATELSISQKLQAGQLNYIPIEDLQQQESTLRSGDLVGLVTNLDGLDVTHSGFLYRKGPQSLAGLLHASVRSGIKISPNLEKYVRGVDGAIGIIVARPISPVPPELGARGR
jgi:hypothetical protein